MSIYRPSTMVRSAVLRPALSTAPRGRFQVRFAHQDYGSGAGDPAGENPQKQGKNEASRKLEHPGPEAPKVGKNKSQESSSESSQPQSKSSGESGGKASGSGKGVKGAQPKILSDNPPGEHDEDVRQHNEEMDRRAEKAHEQVSNEDAQKDKVPPSFWSGHGGRDKDP